MMDCSITLAVSPATWARHAEQFAEVAFALLQQCADLVDFLLVVVELGRQRLATRFGGLLRLLCFGQRRRLFGRGSR